jgi:hypothetical protein
MTTALGMPEPEIRCLGLDDLEQIVAIDRTHTGRARRRFFEKRLEAAKAHPDDFVHVGMVRGGALRGYAMARLQRGEFGREDVVAVFDAIGVQEEGLGKALMDGLVTTLRGRRARRLQSRAEWTSHAVLRFLEASGFELAPRLVLERSVSEPLAEAVDNT